MKTQEIFIARPGNAEQVNALKAFLQALKIKFEVSEGPYDPGFVAKIQQGQQQYRNGEFVSVEKEGLKDFLELE